jgi:hypothetical protein
MTFTEYVEFWLVKYKEAENRGDGDECERLLDLLREVAADVQGKLKKS